MNRYILLLFVFILSGNLFAQYHYPDEWWPIGGENYPDSTGHTFGWLHFIGDTFEVQSTQMPIPFESTIAVASDLTGKLLFYSNGCEIRSANGQLIENGSGLNPGPLHELVCGSIGYTLQKSMATVQVPNQTDRWIVLHLGGYFDPIRQAIYGPLYFTEVDMGANNGAGTIMSKNNVLLEGDLEPLSLVRHGNGRDWWIVLPEYATNNYHLWLLGPSGIVNHSVQSIGEPISCRRIGSSVFSQDGTKFARTNNCAAVVLNFDRCTGQFSQEISLPRPINTYGGGGLIFTPDNRWLYASSDLCLFRADLQSNTPAFDSLFKRPYYEGVSEYVHGTSLAYMQLAPNGVVYMNSKHRESYYSSLQLSDSTYLFESFGLQLPVTVHRTMPHYPNFRLYDWPESPCDTIGINGPSSVNTTQIKDQFAYNILPNPVSSICSIQIKGQNQHQGTAVVHNALGRQIFLGQMKDSLLTFSVNDWPDGIYFITIYHSKGNVWGGKFIVHK